MRHKRSIYWQFYGSSCHRSAPTHRQHTTIRTRRRTCIHLRIKTPFAKRKMPPKKENTKKIEKEKQKIVEDKTFGLKNKNKSKSVQRYLRIGHRRAKMETLPVFSIRAHVSHGTAHLKIVQIFICTFMYIKGVQQQVFQTKKKPDEKRKEEKEKEKLNQQKLLLNSIYQKTEKVKKINETTATYDPKKSKESQKIDIYTDVRDSKNDKENDTIDQWDINKLTEVINIRHKNVNKTDIICKYFLSAVENKQYGWFWVCPNGGDNCKYKHCLPQANPKGYFFPLYKRCYTHTSDRRNLPPYCIIRTQFINNGTPVTLELFKKWLSEREESKKQKKDEQKEKSERKVKTNVLSGKELFTYDPTLFVDDDNAANTNEYDDLFYDDDDQKEDTPEKKNVSNGEVTENDKREDEVPINTDLFIEELVGVHTFLVQQKRTAWLYPRNGASKQLHRRIGSAGRTGLILGGQASLNRNNPFAITQYCCSVIKKKKKDYLVI
ncbi:cytoplasmic translation machinery associated protein, putative [Plasmodium ovale wallikeri]|uniref:Cytoplasmic translation machinery associated protein, putative n=1 Tax=Plasmodium ovale wallikeri TaxID=864142 RepID=A0A1A9A205_PLAOA|nr:cytoplasmic translation machinery associated protein, putative [Plasmodium ovale wallikeri]SBT50516.1 cytoplasmic translation machinery associated protein, putative [Plasmodium ovale wallikeri]